MIFTSFSAVGHRTAIDAPQRIASFTRRWLICLAVASASATSALAQSKPAAVAQKPTGSVAVVNGAAITQSQFDRALANSVAQGQRDSPELRQAIREELIAREVLSQEAVRQKLDRGNDASALLAIARQNVLIDLLIADHLSKNPISDAEVETEYKRQIREVEERGGNQQYRLRQVTVASEAEARAIIGRIRKGESMETIARQSSLAPNKDQGGLLDWLSPLQMLPNVASVVANLSVGAVAAAPILTQDAWSVIKVEDIRPFQAPALDQLRDQMRAALVRERQGALLRSLRASAQVVE